ncbi:hypothetical protein ABIA24_001814 [Sinorhizobium fredii]|uniref:phage tail protein n=1 Tax=Rhizobium fredii TaxID=380 RepID=UPI00351269AB
MGRSKPKQEVTEYRMSEHFGICTGPVDYISEIIINEKTAWTGRRVDNGEILINKPSLFGGVKKEGGAVGTATFLSGGPTQTIPERLAAKAALTTATMPAYRGMASLWFTENEGASYPGFYWTANSPYLPGVWVKVSRASTGLSETKARIYRDLNGPISIYFLLDRSNSLSAGEFAAIKSAVNAGLDLLEEAIEDLEVRVDIGVRFYSAGSTGIERTSCDASDIADIRSFIASAGQVTGGDVEAAMEFVEDWFLATVSTTFSRRAVVFVTDTNTEDNMTAAAAGPAADMLDRDSGAFNLTDGTSVDMYAINYVSTNTTWTSLLDNTPQDGVPVISSTDESGLTNAVADAVRSFDFDSNAAHIIYDCLTNSDWGMGAPVSAIDVDSFEGGADTLFDERFGLSMIWTQQSTIEAFLSEIIDHIEATLFVSPRTGKLTLKLIRDDYSVTGLPEFTPDNSVVTNFSRKLWGETVNEIVVTFTNPDNEEEETVVAQDLANISSQGGIVSDGRNYYGVRTRALATELAHRDLRAASTPLASCDIEVNREAWDLLPGDVVILNSPDDGVEQIIMRVGPVDYGKPGDSVIKAQLVEDVFSLPLADYTVPPKTEAEPTSEDPSPADDTLIFTLPYYLAVQESSELLASAAYPEVIAGVLASEDGSDTSDFELYGEGVDAAGNAIVESLGTKTIASRGTLQAEIDAEAETLFVSFPDRTQGNGPEVGGLMLLEGTDETDSELCLISAFGGSPTAYTMKRGVLDTTPKDWPAGTPVWFVDTAMVFTDPTVRSEGETVDYQVLINTSLGQLEIDDAPIVSEILTARPWLPHRPANVTFEGVGFGTVDVSDFVDDSPAPTFTVAWARRNRVTEDSQILAWDASDVTPETDQTTTITVMDADRNVLEIHDGITGTSYEVPLSSFMDGSPAAVVTSAIVRVTSERDGLESLQGHEINVVLASLTLSGTPVTTATEDDAYAGFTVSASYGTPPYSYSLVGDWPAGITINASSGMVSGTPTEVGSFTALSVRVTDDVLDTAELASFTLNVSAAANTLIYPLTYDEQDANGANALTRLGSGPHVSPAGFLGDGGGSRYKLTSLPGWLASASAAFSLHAYVTIHRDRKDGFATVGERRDTMVYLGNDNANKRPKLELGIIEDNASESNQPNLVMSVWTGSTLLQRFLGRQNWKYGLAWPPAHRTSGSDTVRPQTMMFLDSDTLLVIGHYNDTESRAYKVQISTGTVLGSFTFGSGVYRHVAAIAQRSNGDVWVVDFDSGHALQIDVDASLLAGTVSILSDWNLTNLGTNVLSGIEFTTISGTEHVLIALYHATTTTYLYAIPVTQMVNGSTFNIANRYKRWVIPRQCQGAVVRATDGLLYMSHNSTTGGTNDAPIYVVNMSQFTSLADGGTIVNTRTHYGPSNYPEDIKFHPVTGEAWVGTEGRAAVVDNLSFLAYWRSPLTDNLPVERRVVIDYDGAGTYTMTLDDVLFGTVSATPSGTPACIAIGGPPAASAGWTNGFAGCTVRGVAFKDSAFTDAQLDNLASGAYEPNSLTAYTVSLANPGAESGTGSWTAESGGLGTRNSNPAPRYQEGQTNTQYFTGGTSAATLARQRASIATVTGLTTTQIDAKIASGDLWGSLTWWQTNFNGTDDPGTSGIRFLDGTPTQINVTYGDVVANANQVWRKRFLSVSAPTGARNIDALQRMDRTSGTNNDTYIDDISLVLYSR